MHTFITILKFKKLEDLTVINLERKIKINKDQNSISKKLVHN